MHNGQVGPTLSSSDIETARKLARTSIGLQGTPDDLLVDDYGGYWRSMMNVLRGNFGTGLQERIAIVDSGFSATLCPSVQPVAAKDFIEEGSDDPLGHGSAISALLRLTAPAAKQIIVKIFDRSGKIPGETFEDRAEVVRRALDFCETSGATIVSVSWNCLTKPTGHAGEPRPGWHCTCPLCAALTDFVKRTNSDVFVSEGNFYNDPKASDLGRRFRPTGSWSCPASATLVTPVLGAIDGESPYSTNLADVFSVPVPGFIRVPYRNEFERWTRRLFRMPTAVSLAGSSFATPIAAGTFAGLRSAFANAGMTVHLPRGQDDAEGVPTTAGFNFALDLFFVPPGENENHEREWRLLHLNTVRHSQDASASGDNDEAGIACGLLSALLAVGAAYATNTERRRQLAYLTADMALRAALYARSGSLGLLGIHHLSVASNALELRDGDAMATPHDRLELLNRSSAFPGSSDAAIQNLRGRIWSPEPEGDERPPA